MGSEWDFDNSRGSPPCLPSLPLNRPRRLARHVIHNPVDALYLDDADGRLAEAPFVASEHFSAADITSLVTVDFATRAFDMPISTEMHARWYDVVAARPSATA
jgi:hypothetical protein